LGNNAGAFQHFNLIGNSAKISIDLKIEDSVLPFRASIAAYSFGLFPMHCCPSLLNRAALPEVDSADKFETARA